MSEKEDIFYDKWNSIKKEVNKKKNQVGFKEREIFWTRLGQNKYLPSIKFKI